MALRTLATADDWAGWSALANWVYALSTAAIAVAAAVGITAWRRQLRGQDDFKIAKDLLRAVFGFRDAVRILRSGWMESAEWKDRPGRERGRRSYPETDDLEFAYQARWDRVMDASRALGAAIVEAEASWGENCLALPSALMLDVRSRLAMRLGGYLKFKRFEGHLPPTATEQVEPAISEDPGAPDDLSRRLKAAVAAFEAVARPHLYAGHCNFCGGVKRFAAMIEKRIDEESSK